MDSEAEVLVPGLSVDALEIEELRALTRLAAIVRSGPTELVLRRGTRHRIGRVVVRNTVVTVPPPFESDLFVTFFLYASGADLSRFMMRRPTAVDLRAISEADRFLVLLALLLVELAEEILQIHIARAYMPQESRLHTIRGKPLWGKDFGRHPAEGLTCRYHLLETDNELNRLVLAGVVRAEAILRKTPWASAAHTQGFIWRSIASRISPGLDGFDVAETRLTRLTHHYGPALHIARTLIFGGGPEDPFADGKALLQTFEFNLPSLFERFLARLLAEAWAPLGLTVAAQKRDRNALVDGYGDVYRAVQPDMIVQRSGVPVAVIDAKFKPRYGQGQGPEPVAVGNRVDSADIYQVFFYEARLRHAFDLEAPIPAFILAPLLSPSVTADTARRTVTWRAGLHQRDAKYELRVVRLPIEAMLVRLRQGVPPAAVVNDIPELAELASALQ